MESVRSDDLIRRALVDEPAGSVTRWIGDLKAGDGAGDSAAVGPLLRHAGRAGPGETLRVAQLDGGQR